MIHLNKIFFCFILLFFSFLTSVFSQNDFKEIRFETAPGDKSATYYLTGTIRDAENAEPIAGVSVHIDGFFTGINTDERGQYIARLDSVDEPDVRNSDIRFHDIYLGLSHRFSEKHTLDFSLLNTSYILPQRSHNFSLGYFRNFGEDEWSTSLEGFYRLTENQLEYRDFADLFLNRGLETELIQGQGRAYGAELMVQRNRGAVTGWLAYTYSRSQIRTVSGFQEIQVNRGDWFPTNFDRSHIVSLVANLHLGRNKSLNLLMNYSTGRPVTAPTTNYVVGGIFIPDFGDRNQYRIQCRLVKTKEVCSSCYKAF